MSHSGWACFGGLEAWNNCRTTAYAKAGWSPPGWCVDDCFCCGPDMAQVLGHGTYSNPGTDGAPWFSETEPHSFDFGGFYVIDVTGLGAGAYTRDVFAAANGRGGVLGRPTQAPPVITVQGALLGRTCCAVGYGFRWLNNVLKGSCGGRAGCRGDDLQFLDCCPEICEDSPGFTSFEACLAPFLRRLRGVALTSAPVVTAQYGDNCGCGGCGLAIVEFTLTAAEPCVFREPQVVATDRVFGPEILCPDWVPVPVGSECPDECADPDDCLSLDPSCPPPAKPPRPPQPLNPCVCQPVESRRVCIDIPGDVVPEFAEGVPLLTIRTGPQPVRQLTMRFYTNPIGLPPDQLDECGACGEVTISRIPGSSVFTLDGMNRTVTVTCPGSAATDATRLLGVAGGRLPFSWPELVCGSVPMTLCIEADAHSPGIDQAQVDLSMVVREC